MRVPADPHNPSYSHVFLVGFWRWLTSSGADRKEWRRRRDIALKVQHRQGVDGTHAWADRSRQRAAERQAGRPVHRAPRDPQTAALHQLASQTSRWARFEQWLIGIQLFALLLPVALCVIGAAAVFVWWATGH